ncbi:MAG TPA: MlaD family protein [Candidatus Methylomirabilis sp.]|nr:MlaD family protein [Candidatus Methylomirabilis sp.]
MADGRTFALQIRIGVFILAGLGVFLAIIYLLGAQARYFERKYDLIAEFIEVGGLIEGATVRLAGVQIGRVTQVSLPPEPGGKVRVTLTIAQRFANRIRQDSEARIVTQGLLGDKLVEITMGSAASPPIKPGEHLASREPFEMSQVMADAGETMANIKRLAATLNGVVERVDQAGTLDQVNKLAGALTAMVDKVEKAGTLDDVGALAKSARRIAAQVETGHGLLHAVLYDEPETLRRLNALLASIQDLTTKAQTGDNAVSVLLSPGSGKAARSLLAAMEALGRGSEKAGSGEGLLSALLYDPEYRSVVDDARTIAKNFRDVSERLVRGQGLLGELVYGGDGTSLGQATNDFRVAMANLRALSERLKSEDGTLGALIQDPTVYENLVQFLDGAQRSFLLRQLMRSTLDAGRAARSAPAPGAATTK